MFTDEIHYFHIRNIFNMFYGGIHKKVEILSELTFFKKSGEGHINYFSLIITELTKC